MAEQKHIALITGASSGLGAELARRLAEKEEVEALWLTARRKERLEQLASELPKPCRVLAGDLSDPAFTAEIKKALDDEQPIIQYLVNSAGFGKLGSVEELGEEKNAAMVELNCTALTRLCSIALPHMQKGGKILNIASVAAFMPQPNFTVYAASKAYVLSYSRALHRELKPKGITVTAVCPNPMETEFFQVAGTKRQSSSIKKIGIEKVEDVARRAVRRADRGKDLSLYCFPAKLVRFIAKVLPHRFVLWVEKKIGMY